MNNEYNFGMGVWQEVLMTSLRMGEGIAIAVTNANMAADAFSKQFNTTETK